MVTGWVLGPSRTMLLQEEELGRNCLKGERGTGLSSELRAGGLWGSETVALRARDLCFSVSHTFPRPRGASWEAALAVPWQSSEDHQLHQSCILAQCMY